VSAHRPYTDFDVVLYLANAISRALAENRKDKADNILVEAQANAQAAYASESVRTLPKPPFGRKD
jgi:hypothetical protein